MSLTHIPPNTVRMCELSHFQGWIKIKLAEELENPFTHLPIVPYNYLLEGI